jgi:hypothetical protein
MDAQRDFSARVSRPLYRRLLRYRENNIPAPTLNETLELLMQGSLDLIRQDAEHAKNLVDLDEDLIEIQDWLKVYRNGQ